MEIKFLKKCFSLLIFPLLLSNTLTGCSINKSTNDSYNEKPSSISQDEKKQESKDSCKETSQTETPKKEETEKKAESSKPSPPSNTSPASKTSKIKGKVKLYEGTYFDDKRFGDNSLTLKTYCEVVISNITDTSFDFTVYEISNGEKQDKKVIFLKNTAVFIGDGSKAAFYGRTCTLNFSFPNNHSAYPVVTDIEISGFKPLEGNTYVNNGISGHEFS